MKKKKAFEKQALNSATCTQIATLKVEHFSKDKALSVIAAEEGVIDD